MQIDSMNMDTESASALAIMGEQDRFRNSRIPGVRTVLIVLSARGLVYDTEALRQKVLLAYPEAAVFFVSTQGKALGASCPREVDLLIDFSGPGQRQKLFFAKKLRRMARVAIGRNAGLFRKRIYDRVFDESSATAALSGEMIERERQIQREVLHLAGIALAQAGDTPVDRAYSIALGLPPMANR